MRFFLLLLLAIPILEIVLLIEIGSEIGALATIAWLILGALIGLVLVRAQGFSTLMNARQMMAQGKLPAEALANGLFLALAGILLIIPGFATDALGFLCLIPRFRRLLIRRWFSKFRVVRRFNGQVYEHEASARETNNPQRPVPPISAQTLDGEYKRDE